MRVQVQIEEIDFSDVIVKFVSIISKKVNNDGSASAKICSVAAQLPHEGIRKLLEAVSEEDQHEIAALLVRDHEDQLHQAILQMLGKNEIDVSLDAISLSNQLELSVAVSNVNYGTLAVKYLPVVRDSMSIREHPLIGTLVKLPDRFLLSALSKIPQDKKDEAIASLINKNKMTIMRKIEELLANQCVHIRLSDLVVELH